MENGIFSFHGVGSTNFFLQYLSRLKATTLFLPLNSKTLIELGRGKMLTGNKIGTIKVGACAKLSGFG